MLPIQLTRSLSIAQFAFVLMLAACGGGGSESTGTGTSGAGASSSSSSNSSSSSSSSSVQIPAPSALSYMGPQTYIVGTAISVLNATVTGTVAGYTVSPALPAGLLLNTTSGQITGTPTTATAMANYTITATNGSGSTSFALALTINPLPPAAVTVTVTYGVKQVILNWTAVSGATYYLVSKKSNSTSAYTQLGSNLTAAVVNYADIVAVHLTDWINTSYIVAACNSAGCTNSAAVSSFDAKQAIGYFKASNTDAGDFFGSSVALSGDGNTLAAGSPSEASNATGIDGAQSDNSKSNSGAVYVYTRSSSSWSQQAYIKASNTDTNDLFGSSVALSGDGNTLAVGAYGESSKATGINSTQSDNTKGSSGAVYVFTRNSNGWSQQAYLKASNTDTNDSFGLPIALSADGNTLAVAAIGEASSATTINGIQSDNNTAGSGAVYVFIRNGTSWSQQAYVKASSTDANDYFGSSVALSADGNTLAVSASFEDSNAVGINGSQTDNTKSASGAAYVFVRTGTSWAQQAYIKASNTDSNDQFGFYVALSGDGNTLAVSAGAEGSGATGIDGTQSDNNRPGSGAVYVFVRSGTSWLQQAYIKASNADANDQFGYGVALSADGNTLAVSAILEDSNTSGVNGSQTDNTKSSSGAVYVFTRNGTSWSQRAYVKASNTDAGARFGFAIALNADGDTLAVAADAESSKAMGINGDQSDRTKSLAGAVYVY